MGDEVAWFFFICLKRMEPFVLFSEGYNWTL